MVRYLNGVRDVPRIGGTIDPPDQQTFLQLLAFRDAVRTALSNGHISPADLPVVDDLRIRIDVALAPYLD